MTGPATADDIDDALGWLRRHYVPFRLWVARTTDRGVTEGLIPGLADRGLVADPEPLPGMVLHPLPPAPPEPAGVTVATVDPTDSVALGEHLDTWAAGGLPREIVAGIISPAMAADPDVRLFTGLLDGRPVATSIAIRSGDVSGVYGVGTHESARRRGVGTAVTWAAVEAGRAWGCDTIVLQASDMGLPVYERMGFRTVISYETFAARRSSGSAGTAASSPPRA